MEQSERKPWKKNLYENQGYEDNYTDPSFLKDLKKNYNLEEYTLKQCLFGVTKISQEISVVTIFLIIFYHLYTNEIQPQKLLFNSFALTGIGYLVYIIYNGTNSEIAKNVIEDSKTVFTVLIFGYMFSPILHNLTDSISTDTIFSTTFIILFFHLLLHDYGIDGFLVSKTISLNNGIFASICLASRLSTPFHAFVFLVISVEVFVLKPLFFEKIWKPAMIIPIVGITVYYLMSISKVLLIFYLIILFFINIICPIIFQRLHNHKCTIKGPWDEAIIFSDDDSDSNK